MTTEEAAHLSDVLKAFSEGKPIQTRDLNPASGYSDWRDIGYINLYDATMEYRVKPEPKYRPYISAEEFLKAQKEHGPYICTEVHGYQAVISVYNSGIEHINAEGIVKFEDMLLKNKWQDGTPCGIEENE